MIIHARTFLALLVVSACTSGAPDDKDTDTDVGGGTDTLLETDVTIDTDTVVDTDIVLDTDETDTDETDTDDTVLDTDDTDAVLDTDDTDAVPDTDDTDAAPDTDDTDAVPDTDDTDAVPDTDDTDTVLDTDDTDPPLPLDTVIVCANPLPTPVGGVCDVYPGTADGLLLQGNVLTPGLVYENGEVAIAADGRITCVGCDCGSDPAAIHASVISCDGAVISPGLINPHDHMTFSEGAPLNLGTTRYDHRHDWRGSVSTPSNAHGTGQTSAGNRWVEARQVMAGTTTLVGSGGSLGMLRNPDRGQNEGVTLPNVDNSTFPLGDSNETFRANCGWNYADSEADVAGMNAYVPHVAEGIDVYANEEFRCQSTSFDNGQDTTEPNVAQVHAIGLTAVDYYEMATNDTKLIWSPRSNIALYGHTANARLFDVLGGTIALGTDWTYSGSAHEVRELACADELNQTYYDGWFTDADLWRMATLNGAIALGLDHELGALEPGLLGDIAIYDGSAHPHHRAVIEARNTDVALVLRGGVPLFGDDHIVSALESGCDTIAMCGTHTKSICASREWGTSWPALVSATPGAYAAFFCTDVPTNEPTCVPSRPAEYTGVPTASDLDGDGMPNANDNCPTVFNPLRPEIDGTVQPDADNDGEGDACDTTPLPDDLDGDGVPNFLDVCPRISDNQADADMDGRGDVCDFCPNTPNPDSGVCPPAQATIMEARTTLPIGSSVSVTGVVTGVGSSGFTMQDPSVASGQNAGVYVFTAGAPSVDVGDRVSVQGPTSEYFGELQFERPTVTFLSVATPLTPVDVTVTEAAQEVYEGVLVRITNGTVTNPAYSCAVDGACTDSGLWEIGGTSGVLVYDRVYEDADWAMQIGTLPVTGVMNWRWNRRRIMPRTADDFGP